MKSKDKKSIKSTEEAKAIPTIDKNVLGLRRGSENAKVTFMHRYIYQEDNPNVLLEMLWKCEKKLKTMGIIPKDHKISINDKGLSQAKKHYENKEFKFYTRTDSKERGR